MTAKQLSRKQKEKLRHRYHIIEAALTLFSQKGYHDVSMREIAKKSEFAIGTLYTYFKNKEELYHALMICRAKRHHDLYKTILEKKDEPLKLIYEYIAARTKLFSDNTEGIRLYFAETSGIAYNIKASLNKELRELYDEIIKMLASVFEEGKKRNVFCNIDSFYLATSLEGIINAFLFLWLENPRKHPYDKNVSLIEKLFLKGAVHRESDLGQKS